MIRFGESAPSSSDEIMRLGYKNGETIIEKIGYVLSYNNERKSANWVLECLTSEQIENTPVSRKTSKNIKTFEEDLDIGERLPIEDYKNWSMQSLEKGHLAASGNHTYNFDAFANTYLYSNCVPMYKNVNDSILLLEKQARSLAKNMGKVHIITGPYFLSNRVPSYVREGSLVQVPDAIFKVMVYVKEKDKEKYFVLVYFVKNSSDGCKIRIKFEDLQQLGFEFLCNIPMINISECEMDKTPCMDFSDFKAFLNNQEVNHMPILSNVEAGVNQRRSHGC